MGPGQSGSSSAHMLYAGPSFPGLEQCLQSGDYPLSSHFNLQTAEGQQMGGSQRPGVGTWSKEAMMNNAFETVRGSMEKGRGPFTSGAFFPWIFVSPVTFTFNHKTYLFLFDVKS